jgi:hypothetical protein
MVALYANIVVSGQFVAPMTIPSNKAALVPTALFSTTPSHSKTQFSFVSVYLLIVLLHQRPLFSQVEGIDTDTADPFFLALSLQLGTNWLLPEAPPPSAVSHSLQVAKADAKSQGRLLDTISDYTDLESVQLPERMKSIASLWHRTVQLQQGVLSLLCLSKEVICDTLVS